MKSAIQLALNIFLTSIPELLNLFLRRECCFNGEFNYTYTGTCCKPTTSYIRETKNIIV